MKKMFFAVVLVATLLVSATVPSAMAAPSNPPPGQAKKVTEVAPVAQPAPAAPVAAATPAAPGNPERTTPGTYHHVTGNGTCKENEFRAGQKPNAEWEEGPCPSQSTPVASVTPDKSATPIVATATTAPSQSITCVQATTLADCPSDCEVRSEQLKLLKTTNRLMPLVEKVLDLLVQYLEKLLK